MYFIAHDVVVGFLVEKETLRMKIKDENGRDIIAGTRFLNKRSGPSNSKYWEVDEIRDGYLYIHELNSGLPIHIPPMKIGNSNFKKISDGEYVLSDCVVK